MAGSFCALLLSVFTAVGADDPNLPSGHFGGFYKVTSSTDPMFPESTRREYFLDFGRGIQPNKLSGSVAVSVRQNPDVKVRIMAWQYFPDQGTIVIGNPTVEDPRKAVARGVWLMKITARGALFERESYRMVLQRVDPNDL